MPISVEQTCPECRQRFIGSDVVGYPCPDCLGIGSIDEETLRRAVAAMECSKGKPDGRSNTS